MSSFLSQYVTVLQARRLEELSRVAAGRHHTLYGRRRRRDRTRPATRRGRQR